MDRGWGLTLESDPIGLFEKKPRLNRSLFLGMEFPVNLNRRGEQANSQPFDENRTVISEVDFFANQNKSSDFMDSRASIAIKKEKSPDIGPRTDLNVNTGLHLLTTNTGSDQSTVDDGVSSVAEDKRAKNELAVLQVELERMNAENQRLRGMLSQVSNNYGTLQLHLMTIMQQQQQSSRAESTHQHQIVEGRSEDKKQESVLPLVPRQFMELGPSATMETGDQPSQSSSEERTHSGLIHANKNDIVALNQEKEGNYRDGKAIGREESPESEGWGPNKVPKLSASKSGIDQAAEATMRKARVSVRARSEAPMVQRCAEDRTILITTYEGTHNHPLPPAAVTMASTTSAAANMLLSGSMSSADGVMNPNFLARAILPCSSNMATISASAPFPTITLDLTHPPNPLHLLRPTTQFPFAVTPQPPPPAVAQVFGQALYNQSQFSGLHVSQDVESAQLGHHPPPPPHHSFSDTLTAATAAITADPNFTAALAAAISSIMGGTPPNNNNTTTNNTVSTTTTTTNTTTATSNNKKISGFLEN
ncbi:WRKY DNA-binding protein 31 [Actinidia rufa]|uniref:WRKY DNA-binding protein 31 n=1 Tax=Actinidia rufa TaxID=165716 RepID=A0A7J0EZ68_9ERIC|nr:WRKY DNA-binding protein 31 [Actinidia rufa]